LTDPQTSPDRLETLRAQHPGAIATSLAHGDELQEDGTWRTADGRIVDPQLSDGRFLWRNFIAIVGLLVVGAVAIPATALTVGINLTDVLIAVALWFITGLSITAGYHRLFSHRAYKASWPVRLFFALAGAMPVEGSILDWAKDHRFHHGQVDTIGDPYDARRGFWYSHLTWLFHAGPHAEDDSNVADLKADPIVAWQHRNYATIAWTTNIAVALLLGWITGRWIQMFLIAGVARIVFVQHCTFFINSWAHTFGNRPWSRSHTARDNWVLSLFTFGEGYHNYHHTFAQDYRNGIRWYHWDPSKWLIWTLARVGLAWDLKRIPPEVTLRARFEEERRWFGERLAAAGEGALEEWAAGLKARRAELEATVRTHREALGLRLVLAEAAAEEALREFGQQRKAWLKKRKQALSDASNAAWTEVRELQQRARDSQREAEARWQAFRELVSEYEAVLAKRPEPA
jgi:stearoyl-CoA desaturase (Delta-9 desaturase)